MVDMRGWLGSSLERRCRTLLPLSPNSPPKSPVPPGRSLCTHIWCPSFCRRHLRDQSSDHLALTASGICMHKSHSTVAHKKVFKGQRHTRTPCPSSYRQRVRLLISLHLEANCGPTSGDADTLNSSEPLRTKRRLPQLQKSERQLEACWADKQGPALSRLGEEAVLSMHRKQHRLQENEETKEHVPNRRTR